MLRALMLALLGAHSAACLSSAWSAQPLPDTQAQRPADTNAALEERVNHLASELRCLVCQNQSVADSHAPLAQQLKQEVRKQLAAGTSEDAVREFMVQRYGEFVLYRPPLKGHHLGLWLAPVALLLLSLLALRSAVRAHRLRGHEDDLPETHLAPFDAATPRQP